MPDPLVSTIRISRHMGYHLLEPRIGTIHYEDSLSLCAATEGSRTRPILIAEGEGLQRIVVGVENMMCLGCQEFLWIPVL